LNLELSYIPDTFIKQLIDIVSSLSSRQIIEPIALGLEYAGVAIIVYGAIVSLALLVKAEYRNTRQAGTNQHTFKQQFTSRILTGLEFFIAADVLKTIFSPTLESLTLVAVTVGIRAALTFLLNRELRHEEELKAARKKRLEAEDEEQDLQK
jgi:uncharacterized membrane protein